MTGLRAVRRQTRKRQRVERGARALGLLVAKGLDPANLLSTKRPIRINLPNGKGLMLRVDAEQAVGPALAFPPNPSRDIAELEPAIPRIKIGFNSRQP